jgi:hypothetical protein
VEFDYNLGAQISAPIPDAEGTNPQLVILEGTTDYIDTTAFTGLHAIIFADLGAGWNFLTVTGGRSVSIYLGDLSGPSTDSYKRLFCAPSSTPRTLFAAPAAEKAIVVLMVGA